MDVLCQSVRVPDQAAIASVAADHGTPNLAQHCRAKSSMQAASLRRLRCLCRVILEPAMEGRLRLDAATWGTMGVGLGYAIAAATTRPERLVVAVEGDSAFGFSGMECETIAR